MLKGQAGLLQDLLKTSAREAPAGNERGPGAGDEAEAARDAERKRAQGQAPDPEQSIAKRAFARRLNHDDGTRRDARRLAEERRGVVRALEDEEDRRHGEAAVGIRERPAIEESWASADDVHVADVDLLDDEPGERPNGLRVVAGPRPDIERSSADGQVRDEAGRERSCPALEGRMEDHAAPRSYCLVLPGNHETAAMNCCGSPWVFAPGPLYGAGLGSR